MLEIGSSRPLTGLTQILYIYIYIYILTVVTVAVTQKQLHKKETENDLSLQFFCKKEVDWVVNDWVYSSSTFIDQERDCHCGI